MAVRTPLVNDGNDLREATAAEITQIKEEMIRQYSLNPSVTLAVVASAGSLGSIDDTRLQAGAHSVSATAFPSEAVTAEPSTVTVSYDKLDQTTASVATPTDTNNKAFPVYYTAGGEVQSMTLQDMIDTFALDVIDTLTNGSFTTDQAGTYRAHTANTLAGATLVDATPFFVDTRADTALYTAASIPEALDQPTTITNYYLFQVDAAAVGTIPTLFDVDASNDLQEISAADLGTMLQDIMEKFN